MQIINSKKYYGMTMSSRLLTVCISAILFSLCKAQFKVYLFASNIFVKHT